MITIRIDLKPNNYIGNHHLHRIDIRNEIGRGMRIGGDQGVIHINEQRVGNNEYYQ